MVITKLHCNCVNARRDGGGGVHHILQPVLVITGVHGNYVIGVPVVPCHFTASGLLLRCYRVCLSMLLCTNVSVTCALCTVLVFVGCDCDQGSS